MKRKWVVAAVACAALLIPAVLTAMVTKTGGGAASSPTRLGPNEEFSYLGQGSNESGEAERSAAQEDYENRAYPSATIGFSQTLGAIKAGKKVKDKDSKLNAKWKELGPDTLEVGQFGTQNLMVPTQWTGRIAALAVDYKHCRNDECRLYIGSAGGGVWMTNNALANRPHWHERNDGLDSRAIGSLVIDPTDTKGPATIYAGTGEENGSSDNEAGLGVYKSTDDGHHWTVLPGSVAAAKDRGVGDIAIDPTDPKHIYIGTMVARHGISSSNGGRFTPPGAPRLGLYESKDGGDTFTLIYSRDQDPVVPGTPTGLDLFRGAISRIQFDPNDPSIFYFTMFNYGAFRAKITPAGTTVTQIFTEPNPNPPGPAGLAGIRFELAAAALPGGKTRLYLGEGSDEVGGTPPTVDASKLWRTDDAAAVAGNGDWTLLSNKTDGTPGYSSYDFCRNQCSYDMPVASPPGQPDEVWLGGVTQYQELPSRTASYRSNGRAVMRSVDGGVQFTDATGDARHFFLDIHPDIHAFAFAPGGDHIRRLRRRHLAHERELRGLLVRLRHAQPHGREPQGLPRLAVRDPGSDHRDELGAERARVPGARRRSERPERHHRRHAGQRLADVRRARMAHGRSRRRRPDGHRRRRRYALPPVLRRLAAGELGRHRPDSGSLDVDLRLDARVG